MSSVLEKRVHASPIRARVAWVVMAALSVAIAFYAARYFAFNPAIVAPPFAARLVHHDPWLLMHIGGGVIALAVGSFQFLPSMRTRFLRLHRWIGRVYLLAVLSGGIGGLQLSTKSVGGLATHFGFGMLAVLWLAFSAMAYWRVLQRDFANHSAWVIRSYALTLAAVMLRLQMPLARLAHMDMIQAYQAISWLCWVPNIVVAEMLVARFRQHPLRYYASPQKR